MWKYSLNPYAKVFTPTYKSLKMLNYDAKIFITFLGICVISVIVVIIFILTLVILSVLDYSGKQCVGELSPNIILKELKISNPNKLMIAHLNINSIRYKFECLKDIIVNNVDILLISETKLNDTFPNGQSLMNSFHPPFRKDRRDKGGGGVVCCYIYRKMYPAGRSWLSLNQILKLYLLKLI